MGLFDLVVGVGTQPGRLTRKVEFEVPAAGALPSPRERDRGIRTPALGMCESAGLQTAGLDHFVNTALISPRTSCRAWFRIQPSDSKSS